MLLLMVHLRLWWLCRKGRLLLWWQRRRRKQQVLQLPEAIDLPQYCRSIGLHLRLWLYLRLLRESLGGEHGHQHGKLVRQIRGRCRILAAFIGRGVGLRVCSRACGRRSSSGSCRVCRISRRRSHHGIVLWRWRHSSRPIWLWNSSNIAALAGAGAVIPRRLIVFLLTLLLESRLIGVHCVAQTFCVLFCVVSNVVLWHAVRAGANSLRRRWLRGWLFSLILSSLPAEEFFGYC